MPTPAHDADRSGLPPGKQPVFDREFDRPLSPRERAAVAKAVKIASRGAAARNRKERARQALAAKIRSGEYISPAELKKAQAAGVSFGTRGIVGKTVKNLVEDVEYAPAGAYQLGKAGALDVRDIVQHPASGNHFKRTAAIGKQIGEGTVESFQHPLRRPGDTLLNLLAGYGALAGGVSRVSAAANAARLAERGTARAAITRAGHEGGSLLHRPVPGPRIHTVGGLPVRGKYSASAGIRAAQRAKDRIIEGSDHPLAEAVTVRRAGKELGQNRRVAIAAKRGPAGRLAHMGKRLTKPQQQALRIWGQGLTVDEKIAQHTRELGQVAASGASDAAKARRTRDLNHRIALAEAARPYMDGNELSSSFKVPRKKGGRRGASPKEMRAVARQAERVAGKRPGGREHALLDAGLITPEQMDFRIDAPGRLGLGAEWTTAAEEATRRLSKIEGERATIRRGATTTIPEHTKVTARPRTREEAQALHDKLQNAIDPLVTSLAKALRSEEPKRGKVKDNFFHFQDLYGKRLGAYIADLPDEDRIREGYGRDIAPRRGEANPINYAAEAERMIGQATGADTNYTYPTEMLLDLRESLKGQGVDPDALGAAIRKQDELRKALEPDIEEVFGTPRYEPTPSAERQVPDLDEMTRVLKERHGKPGISKEQSWYAGLQQYNPNAPVYVFRDKSGEPAGMLQVMLDETGKPDLLQVSVRPDMRRQGIATKLYDAAAKDYDISTAIGKEGLTKEGAAFANAYAAPKRDFGSVETKTVIPEQRVPGDIDDEGMARLAELDRQEVQAFEMLDRGDELTLTGAEGHRGRIRVPDVPTKESRPSFVGTGVYRGGQPRKPGSLSKSYRGELERSGDYKVNTTRNVALSALEAHRYTNVLDLRQKVLAAGVKARPADTKALQWVPVREKALTDKQRRQLREAGPVDEHEAALQVAGGEKARVAQENARWSAFLEDIFPEEELGGTPVGAEVENVVWVPRQLLANMNKPFARSPFAGAVSVLDTGLNLVKFGVIPLKAAYVTANAVGNALFNVFQQGVFLPRNWKQAAALVRDKRTGPILREVIESGGMQALVGGNPKGLGLLNKGMHAYANVLSEAMLEPMMRVSSFVHEARRFGYKSNAQIYRLLTDPARADDLAEIARRGKDAIVDYDRMGPMEKAVMRRALFIYPWVKGATVYGGQFLLEHPVQSGVIGAVGSYGREQTEKQLGELPSWAQGSFRVGGTDQMPLVVNPATISPFSQAAEIAQTVTDSLTGEGGTAGQLGGLLHPAIQAAIEAGYKRDQFTGAPLQGSFPSLLFGRSIEQTAPATLLSGLAKAGRPPGRRAYPMTKAQVIERALIGSFSPRTANREALNEAARKEDEANLTPAQRARRNAFRERQAIFVTMKQKDPQLLVGGRLPAPVRQAYNRKAEVDATRAAARQKARGDSSVYYREVAVAEAKLLERWGAAPKGFAADVARQTRSLNALQVEKGVQKMRDDLMPGAYRDITSEGAKYLERRAG